MKTAVEWLIEHIQQKLYIKDSVIDQANKMFEEQIKDAYNTSFILRDKPYSTADKYYNETFKSE